MAERKSSKKKGLNLFWRIYFYGLALLATVAIAAIFATHAMRDLDEAPAMRGPTKTLARLLVMQIQRGPENREKLQELLQDINTVSRISISIHENSGACLARAGSIVPKPLPADDAIALSRHKLFRHERMLHLAVPLVDDGRQLGYALLSWDRSAGFARHLFFFGAVFVLLALMPFLLARAIAKPLAKISATARAIGTGNLSARTGLARRDEVGSVARAVDQMAERLEHMVRSEKELLANVSHEIRTPLARIRVLLELLEEGKGGDEAIESHLSALGEDVIELEKLLDDVLLTARLDLSLDTNRESGFVLNWEKIELPTLIERVTQRFSEREPKHALHINLKKNLPIISGDASLLRRVLYNLLDNAAKYTDSEAPIELAIGEQEKEVLIEIRDRGMGISEQDIHRIFEPFFRTDRSRSAEVAGTGIGLTLCRRIVEAHNGTISAQKRTGGGIILSLSLPIGD